MCRVVESGVATGFGQKFADMSFLFGLEGEPDGFGMVLFFEGADVEIGL
jgi:hypothetical protein